MTTIGGVKLEAVLLGTEMFQHFLLKAQGCSSNLIHRVATCPASIIQYLWKILVSWSPTC